jgi:DNA-3-methyladenine glycosylase II
MNQPGELAAALDFLARQDPDFGRALELIQPLPDRSRPAGFEHLSKIIVEQQVSLASAEAIWNRMLAVIQPYTPERVLQFTEEKLRDIGLSRQKAKYCRALAEDISSNKLSLEQLDHLEDEAVLAQLVQVKGIGRWTAEVYMIACLGRTDVWPAGDVALQSAMGHLKDLAIRPNIEMMDQLATPLRPYRTVAARVLWRYYADVVQKSRQ